MADIASKLILTTGEFVAGLTKADREVQRFQVKLRDFGAKTAALGASLAAPFVLMGKSVLDASIQFESAFAGIRKTVDATEQDFQKLEKNILDLSKTTPIAATELAKIGEIAGQLGVRGVNNITKFTDTIARIGVSTNLSTDQAATQFARLLNIMGESTDVVDRVGSAIVGLGNNFATTESEISEFALRLAGAGRTIGLTSADVLGIGAALSALGLNAEAGGTAFSKVMVEISAAAAAGGDSAKKFASIMGLTVQEFQRLVQTSPKEAILQFVESLGRAKDSGANLFVELERLGLSEIRLRDALLRTANAGGTLREAIAKSGEEFEKNNALLIESEKHFATTQGKIDKFTNTLTAIQIKLGNELKPALAGMVDALSPVIAKIETLIETNPELVRGLLAFGAAVAVGGTLLVGLGALAFALGTLGAAMSPLIVGVLSIAAIVGLITAFSTSLEDSDSKVSIMADSVRLLGESLGLASPKAEDMKTKIEEVGTAAEGAHESIGFFDSLLRNFSFNVVTLTGRLRIFVEFMKTLKGIAGSIGPGFFGEFDRLQKEFQDTRANILFDTAKAQQQVLNPGFAKGFDRNGNRIAQPSPPPTAEPPVQRLPTQTVTATPITKTDDAFFDILHQRSLADLEAQDKRDKEAKAKLQEEEAIEAERRKARGLQLIRDEDLDRKTLVDEEILASERRRQKGLQLIADEQADKQRLITEEILASEQRRALGLQFIADEQRDKQKLIDEEIIESERRKQRGLQLLADEEADKKRLIEEEIIESERRRQKGLQLIRDEELEKKKLVDEEILESERRKQKGLQLIADEARDKAKQEQAQKDKQTQAQGDVDRLRITGADRKEIAQAEIRVLQAEFERLSSQDIISVEQEERLKTIAVRMQELNKVSREVSPIWREVGATFKGAMRDMVRGVLQGTQSIGDLFNRMLENIAAAFVEKGISDLIDKLISGASEEGGLLSTLSGLFSGEGKKDGKGGDSIIDSISTGFGGLVDKMGTGFGDMFGKMSGGFSSVLGGLQGGFGGVLGFLQGGLGNLVNSLSSGLSSLFGGGGLGGLLGGGGGGLGGLLGGGGLSSLFGGGGITSLLGAFGGFGFREGGIMTPKGPVQLRAFTSGGVASNPTLALFGEGTSNEAFVPLPDGRRIPVVLQGGSGRQRGSQTVVNVINNTKEKATEERRKNSNGDEEIFITIGKKLGEQVRRRGPLGMSIEEAFGLNLQPGTR